MKELVILSGKGGTGKTSIVGSFAALAKNAVFCDADVDAADLHLLLKPDVLERREFTGGGKAYIRRDACTSCGTCVELCQWNAIDDSFQVDPLTCEGCGVCVSLCPEKAIDFPPATCGEWYVSDTRFGPLVHARLGIAEENSGKPSSPWSERKPPSWRKGAPVNSLSPTALRASAVRSSRLWEEPRRCSS